MFSYLMSMLAFFLFSVLVVGGVVYVLFRGEIEVAIAEFRHERVLASQPLIEQLATRQPLSLFRSSTVPLVVANQSVDILRLRIQESPRLSADLLATIEASSVSLGHANVVMPCFLNASEKYSHPTSPRMNFFKAPMASRYVEATA